MNYKYVIFVSFFWIWSLNIKPLESSCWPIGLKNQDLHFGSGKRAKPGPTEQREWVGFTFTLNQKAASLYEQIAKLPLCIIKPGPDF